MMSQSRNTFCNVVVLLLVSTAHSDAADAPQHPNVLFIAIDDLNDWVGFLHGHPQALTPNMDRLAARGIVFTNAHCASPACNPSRAAIFSGKMPWKTNVWSNKSKKLFAQHPEAHVLPDSFRDAGYATYGTGKMMHSGASANKRIFEHHFDVEQRWSPFTKKSVAYTKAELPSKGSNNPRHVLSVKDSEPVVLPLNRMTSDRNPTDIGGESFDWGPLDVPDSAMGDSQITDWAIEKLGSGFDKPFFIGIGYYRPHIPLWAPQKYFKRFAEASAELPPLKSDDLEDLSDSGRQWAIEADTAGLHATVVKFEQHRQAVEAYLACTTFVDAQIGRLLDAFDSGQYGDNTIIVLWSDHGWHLGEKQHWGKWTGWERSTRVPLIIVPSQQMADTFAKPGSRCVAPVSLIDLYPTLIELCQLKHQEGLDGTSLVPMLHHPDRKTNRVAITAFDRGNVTIRDDRWRLIQYADGSRELYDLENDPNEWTNLADDIKHEKRIEKLSRQIPVEALPRQDSTIRTGDPIESQEM